MLSVILTYSLGCFFAYCYPMKYCDEIKKYSLEFDVDGGLVASVINVESGYREGVISSKGAKGLMQIIPSTGEWLADRLGEEFEEEKLLDSDFNIKLGTYYLSYLIGKFGDVKIALCSYNAGEGNVKSWLKDERYSSNGKELTKIPFKETENYVNRVEKNYKYYKNKYQNTPK